MGVVQMNSNPLAKDFNTGSLLKFAFPTISMMLFMGLYTIVDTIFVSRFVNTNALSAINIVCPVINLIVGLGTMIATGGSAIVARKMGAGEPKRAKQDFTLLILFGFILGVVIFILGIIFIDEIIYALGADKVLFPYCKDYLTIILLFTPASMLQVLFQNLFVTAGKPTLGLVLSVSAGVMNIVFDYLFMVIFDMGIAGAGFGTGIGYLIPAITGLIVFCKKSGTLSFVKPIIDIKVLGESCINGSSEMVSQLSTAITTFFFNRTMMNLLGVNGVASITIIIYTQFLLTTLFIGFSMGVAPVISYNFGANNYYGLKKIYKICISFIFVGSLFIFALSFINGNTLVRLLPKYFLKFACTSGSGLFMASSIVASISARISANETPPAFAPAFKAFLISRFFRPIIITFLYFFHSCYSDYSTKAKDENSNIMKYIVLIFRQWEQPTIHLLFQ